MPKANRGTSTSAGIIIYRKTKEGLKFLLLYHGHGYWNFPKGHVEHMEKSLKTAFREVREETGLKESNLILKKSFRTANKYVISEGKKKIFRLVIFYLAESKNKKVKISDEHNGYGWFLYRDAMWLLKFGSLREILKKAKTLL